MQVNDELFGFRVTRLREVPDQDAVLVEMEYVRNGARLIWLDRDDSNMTYAITFKTLPSDDTGVFHILEHSVLNGSEKFPLKEPFVDLLKCSLQTFLNAITFSDKTMYPVSSRNSADFLNLVDVYTDAVFHPCIYSREETFLQEGWHEEWDEETDTLSLNGIVYSEMKGSFASVLTQANTELERLLFPDTCYRYVSGGHPDSIPSLTYQTFLETHRRFYHPSNAIIVLDGSIELNRILPLLDGYLREYERSGEIIEIGEQMPVCPPMKALEYEIGEQDTPEHRGVYLGGFVFGDCDDFETGFAVQALADVLAGSNEAPLRKALLDRELCEDFSIDTDVTRYLTACFTAMNTDEEKLSELLYVIEEVLSDTVKNGLEPEQLIASLNSMEFSIREKDYGGTPRGIVNAVNIMSTALYGRDPAGALVYGDLFDRLRDKVTTDYYVNLIRRVFLNNSHKASVYMRPSTTLRAEKQQAFARRMRERADALTREEKEAIAARQKALLLMQQTPDPPEASACLPRLRVSDLAESPDPLHIISREINGTETLHVPIPTNGIQYYGLLFDISDLAPEDVPYASFLSELYGEFETELHTGLELQAMLKKDLGSFSCSTDAYPTHRDIGQYRAFFMVHFSVLSAKLSACTPLVREVLLSTRLDNPELLEQLLRQRKSDLRQAITAKGTSFASGRVSAEYSPSAAFNEYAGGIEYYRWICEMAEHFTEHREELIRRLEALASRIFRRKRLTLALTGAPDEETDRMLIDLFPEGKTAGAHILTPLARKCEGFVIPSDVGFAAVGCNLRACGLSYRGDIRAAANLLSYDYFWNKLRVQGGAYGAGIGITQMGALKLTTFRDPRPAASLSCFRGAAEYLRANLPEQEALESLIIGAVADETPIRSPRVQGAFEIFAYLSGLDSAILQRHYRELIHADRNSLLLFADLLDTVAPDCTFCVIGGEKLVRACAPDVISSI